MRRIPENASGAARRQQEPSEGIERRARAVCHAGVGEMHPDTRQHLAGDDGLGDVVDAARFQSFDDVFGLGQAGHEDDRHVRQRRILLELSAGREAVGSRHQRIHENDVGDDLLDDRKCMLAFARDEDGHAGLFESIGQQPQCFGQVIDHQHDVAAVALTHERHEPPATPRRIAGNRKR